MDNQREREQEIRYLTEKWGGVGISRDEAELRVLDSGIWLVPAEHRHVFEGEEGVRQLLKAAAYFQARAALAMEHPAYSDAMVQGYEEAAYRMKEAARRARERLEGARE